MFTLNTPKKLKKMGINGAAHKWFENYLKGRTQKVDIDGHLSEEQNLIFPSSKAVPSALYCFCAI
jgi:hypothetical protein